MAVVFRTSNPNRLLKAFNDRIDQKDREGQITTWERNSKGEYTHKASAWHRKAWFQPIIVEPVKGVEGKKDVEGILRFNLVSPKDGQYDRATYSYYHGHLIETFLNHFENSFTYGVASAKPLKK
jgi:hypothetical protein